MATEAGWEPHVHTLRTPGGPQEPTRRRGYFPRASGGAQPCRQLAPRLAASGTWREQVSVTLGPSVCGNLLQRPRDSNTNPRCLGLGRADTPWGDPKPTERGDGVQNERSPPFQEDRA